MCSVSHILSDVHGMYGNKMLFTYVVSPVFVELHYIRSNSEPRWESKINCLSRCFSSGQTSKRNDSVLRSELFCTSTGPKLLSGQ